ncbi:MAG: phosphodiesterase [Rhodospirillaceae bacterium]|nr:phosphodiesterase [Rhodospirillaceae bacterium]
MAAKNFEAFDMILAQISDLHLRTDGNILKNSLFGSPLIDSCIEHINGLRPHPDVVLATGDLVNTPSDQDYEALRTALDELSVPVYVIPGNHDGREELRETFSDWGYLPEGPFLHYTVEHYPLRLIGLDTLAPGKIGGEMCSERLSWLDQKLSEEPGRPTLIFMHPPPFETGIGKMDAHGFEGVEELEQIVSRHSQIEWIACGHLHRPIHARFGGTVASCAPSPVFQMTLDLTADGPKGWRHEPPGIQVYYWQPNKGVVTHYSVIGDFGPVTPF